jgi:LysR family transcriptional regulator for bpeEF and oprC
LPGPENRAARHYLPFISVKSGFMAGVAAVGTGVAQVPDLLAVKQVEEGKLVPILVGCVAAAPSLLLVYPGNRYQTAKLRAFIDYFTGVFKKQDSWKRILARLSP